MTKKQFFAHAVVLAAATLSCLPTKASAISADKLEPAPQALTSQMIPQLIDAVDQASLESTLHTLASSKYDSIVARILKVQGQPASVTRSRMLDDLRQEFDLIATKPAPGNYITTRSSFSDKSPTGRGIGQAAAWLEQAFRSLSPRFEVKQDCFEVQSQQVCNVVAKLPAVHSPSAPVIVVGAHYDSRVDGNTDGITDAPGATDNASGTAAVLEMARIASGYSFPTTLLFVAFAAEEQGLLGSRHFVPQLTNEGQRVIAMVNNDLVGNSWGNRGGIDNELGANRYGGDFFRIFTDTAVADAHELWLSSREETVRYCALVGIKATLHDAIDREGRGGDHKPFLEQGIPAIRMTAGLEDYSHQHTAVRWLEDGRITGDLLAFVDISYLARITRANLATILPLAIRLDDTEENFFRRGQ